MTTIQSQRSFKNRAALEKSKLAACYYCLATYQAKEITEWTDRDETALCPACGMDSVVAEDEGQLPDMQTLEAWRKDSFSET